MWCWYVTNKTTWFLNSDHHIYFSRKIKLNMFWKLVLFLQSCWALYTWIFSIVPKWRRTAVSYRTNWIGVSQLCYMIKKKMELISEILFHFLIFKQGMTNRSKNIVVSKIRVVKHLNFSVRFEMFRYGVTMISVSWSNQDIHSFIHPSIIQSVLQQAHRPFQSTTLNSIVNWNNS